MYSNLKVCESVAGYYIGREWIENNISEPYSRESNYYLTKEAAKIDLLIGLFVPRDCAENNFSYNEGSLPDITQILIYYKEIEKAKLEMKG
jgi:uncharacterized membrane protein